MNTSLAFEVVVAVVLQVSLLVLATVWLQRHVRDSRDMCRMWTVCFVSILALICVAFFLPHRRMLFLPSSLAPHTLLEIVAWQAWLIKGLAIIWLIGIAVSLLRRAFQCWQLVRFLKQRCLPATEAQLAGLPSGWHDAEGDSADTDRPPRSLSILVSAEINGPFCWQLHRPMIVLPQYLVDGDAMHCRHVLLHELEHLRTNHPMQHFLQGVCSTLLWFHPAVWVAARDAELAREFLCDEVAARRGGRFADYLRTLLKIAERCTRSPLFGTASGALAFGNRKSALVRRSERLLELASCASDRQSVRPNWAIAGLLLVAMLVSQVWLPTNALATHRSQWSPWPTWTATTLHDFGVTVRDFETFDERTQMHELLSGN